MTGTRPRIPLTVIGGFLGAGKTTLVNHLLTRAGERRLAILVNDFGAINVDRSLISHRDAAAIELTNGCVCCQIGDDLGAALIALIESARPPDAIVIEASGVSDPWRIAQVGLADPALTLDAVLVLVDASSVRAHAEDPALGDTVLRQLRSADLLIVNHCDRVDAAALAALSGWFDRVCPDGPRFETTRAMLPAELLGNAPARITAHRHGPGCGCTGTALPGAFIDHGEQFETWCWRHPPRFDADALKALLRAMPSGILRMKGLVRTDRHELAELQFAGRHGSLRAASVAPGDSSGTRSRTLIAEPALVAIGLRGALPAAALERALRDAVRDA